MRSAGVGIGSNSVRALVVETTGESFVRLWRGREGTRLFAGLDGGGLDFGLVTTRFPLERTGFLDQLGKAGVLPDAGEVGVLRDAVRVPEPEVDGVLQLGERAGCPALRERAGEVVVPGGVAGDDGQRLAADFLHLGVVTRLHHLDQLLAQLYVARPDLGHPPDGQRFLLGRADGRDGQ